MEIYFRKWLRRIIISIGFVVELLLLYANSVKAHTHVKNGITEGVDGGMYTNSGEQFSILVAFIRVKRTLFVGQNA